MGSYIWLVVLGGIVVLMLGVTRRGHIGAAEAKRLLSENAVIVDVRSETEFASGSVPGAINIPLGQVAQRLEVAVTDKSSPILLHCHSGGRSGIAVGTARKLGYTRVYNLGSLGRAGKIVGAQS